MENALKTTLEISDSDKLSSEPLVSIHMITYNHEKFIAKAIEGVVSQRVDFPIELLIGDDCSTDGTRNIILEYQKKYPHLIRVIYSESNVGPTKNFYRLYKSCKGKYIAMCEGDDCWVDNEKLAKQINFLSKHNDYAAAYHDYTACIEGDTDKPHSSKSHVYDTDQHELILGGGGFQHSTICFRNNLGDFPEEFFKVTGGDLFLRSLLGNLGKGKYIRDITPSIYNIHAGGIWSGLKKTEQLVKNIETRCWMATYYSRINMPDIATHFACNAMTRISNDLVTKKPIFLIWFLKQYFKNTYKYYKEIKSTLFKKRPH